VRQYVEDEVRAPDGMGTKEDKRGKRRTNIQQTAADEWQRQTQHSMEADGYSTRCATTQSAAEF